MRLPAAHRLTRPRFASLALAALLVCGLLAGCAVPQGASQRAGSSPTVTPAQRASSHEAPSASTTPATPELVGGTGDGPSPATPVEVDTTCRTDADCAVKNVGNCCGYLPACVNTTSRTDPQGVQAECARSGRMSVCGFREISACQCVKGQCEPAAGGLEVQ